MMCGSVTPPAADEPKRSACGCILLVDDHEGVRNATAMLLRTEGFEVLCAASLREAREALRTGSPIDLVIADYHLQGGETGIDVISMARSVVGEHLAAVLMSGDTSTTPRDVQDTGRLRLAGKPIRARELLAMVTELLSIEKAR